MKKRLLLMLVLALILPGCKAEETVETVADEWVEPVMAKPKQIAVELPGDVAAPVMESDTEQLYLCDGYEILIETRDSGDLSATIQALSGYGREELTVMSTEEDAVARHEFVWASTGEEGERLGRGVVLDDGSYHYCMSILRDAATTENSQIVWDRVFSSFQLL